MKNIAVFASGQGSNAKALLTKEKELQNSRIQVLLTDRKKAGVIQVARDFDKEIIVIPKARFSRSEHEQLILSALAPYKIDWVLLAGYMRLLSPQFIQHFYDKSLRQSRIINIHPSLLPLHKGINAYEKAYQQEPHESGITVHFVDDGMDTGKIIKQAKFQFQHPVSFTEFKNTGLQLEHQLYPQVLQEIDQNGLQDEI